VNDNAQNHKDCWKVSYLVDDYCVPHVEPIIVLIREGYDVSKLKMPEEVVIGKHSCSLIYYHCVCLVRGFHHDPGHEWPRK